MCLPGSRFSPSAWHTFWNSGDEPCEIVEIISPAGFRELLSRRCCLPHVSANALTLSLITGPDFSGDFPSGESRELSRNVDQPDHVLADPIISHKAERRPGPGEIWLAVTKHDGVQVDSILIDQAKLGEALRQVRASNFDLPVAFGLQLADRALKIILNEHGVGADRLQRARDDPFRLVPPRRREGVFLCIPFRTIVVPVTHDLIHLATVDTARLALGLLDEVAEERGAWHKRHMVDVAVQGLVHSEHELSHTTSFPLAAHPRGSDWRYAIGRKRID